MFADKLTSAANEHARNLAPAKRKNLPQAKSQSDKTQPIGTAYPRERSMLRETVEVRRSDLAPEEPSSCRCGDEVRRFTQADVERQQLTNCY